MNNPDAKVFCPVFDKEITIDLCKETQMKGDNEFVPEIIEDELAPDRIRQCQFCTHRTL